MIDEILLTLFVGVGLAAIVLLWRVHARAIDSSVRPPLPGPLSEETLVETETSLRREIAQPSIEELDVVVKNEEIKTTELTDLGIIPEREVAARDDAESSQATAVQQTADQPPATDAIAGELPLSQQQQATEPEEFRSTESESDVGKTPSPVTTGDEASLIEPAARIDEDVAQEITEQPTLASQPALIDEESPGFSGVHGSPAGQEEAWGVLGQGIGDKIGNIDTEEGKLSAKSKKQSQRSSQKYKGFVRKPPKPQVSPQSIAPTEAVPFQRSLPLEVRLLLERGGASCTVSLVAKRSSDLPEELTVITRSGAVDLQAMQEEWYQDVVPDDIGNILRNGASWSQTGESGGYSWLRSGREIYVLGKRSGLRGYVSQACLELGREHAVLCTEQLRDDVEEAIMATGAKTSQVLDASTGVPSGWVVFLNVVPTMPIPPVDEVNILNALRPLAKIEISLEGGIRLRYATWLEGYPPLIRVYGDAEHTAEVVIDNQRASCGEDGAYRVSGWDSVGPQHMVWCGGTRKSYSIVSFVASWQLWDAYEFPDPKRQRRISICGPMVQAIAGEEQRRYPLLLVPKTNPVIVGSVPGEYVVAIQTFKAWIAPRTGSPLFRPVWALPDDPLHCNKEVARVLLIGGGAPPHEPDSDQESKRHRRANIENIKKWCQVIRKASQKGLRTEPDDETTRNLWNHYKDIAKRISKRWK